MSCCSTRWGRSLNLGFVPLFECWFTMKPPFDICKTNIFWKVLMTDKRIIQNICWPWHHRPILSFTTVHWKESATNRAATSSFKKSWQSTLHLSQSSTTPQPLRTHTEDPSRRGCLLFCREGRVGHKSRFSSQKPHSLGQALDRMGRPHRKELRITRDRSWKSFWMITQNTRKALLRT